MNLPILADVITNAPDVATQVVYRIPPEIQLFVWASVIFDVIIFAFMFWTLYRDFTYTHVLYRDGDVFNIKKISPRKTLDNKLKLAKDRIHEITTKVKLLKKPFGIYVPFFMARHDFAGTCDLADPCDPKKDYIEPKVFSVALAGVPEKELQTIRIDKQRGEIIGYIAIGVIIGAIVVMVFSGLI